MGAYKRDVVVVKMGAYIHGCLFCVGAYYSDFTVCVYCCIFNRTLLITATCMKDLDSAALCLPVTLQ